MIGNQYKRKHKYNLSNNDRNTVSEWREWHIFPLVYIWVAVQKIITAGNTW